MPLRCLSILLVCALTAWCGAEETAPTDPAPGGGFGGFGDFGAGAGAADPPAPAGDPAPADPAPADPAPADPAPADDPAPAGGFGGFGNLGGGGGGGESGGESGGGEGGGGSAAPAAPAVEMGLADLPITVRDQVERLAPGLQVEEVERDEQDGRVVYEIRGDLDGGGGYSLDIYEDATLRRYGRDLPDDQRTDPVAPDAVVAAARAAAERLAGTLGLAVDAEPAVEDVDLELLGAAGDARYRVEVYGDGRIRRLDERDRVDAVPQAVLDRAAELAPGLLIERVRERDDGTRFDVEGVDDRGRLRLRLALDGDFHELRREDGLAGDPVLPAGLLETARQELADIAGVSDARVVARGGEYRFRTTLGGRRCDIEVGIGGQVERIDLRGVDTGGGGGGEDDD